jgi:AraC-like DNA-binding protein
MPQLGSSVGHDDRICRAAATSAAEAPAVVARAGSDVAYAVNALFAREPPSIAALSRERGWSRQHLTRTFQATVAITPKQLGRVAWLQRAVAELQTGGNDGLADAAARLG